MVWGAMAWAGCGNIHFIDGIMNKEVYLDILKDNLHSSARKLRISRGLIFQQDGDPKHTSKLVANWFRQKKVTVLEWPAQSPDLNPIEHLWSILKKKVQEQNPSNINNLKEIIKVEWSKIDQKITSNLVESMPRRCQAVINAKGAHTKYQFDLMIIIF